MNIQWEIDRTEWEKSLQGSGIPHIHTDEEMLVESPSKNYAIFLYNATQPRMATFMSNFCLLKYAKPAQVILRSKSPKVCHNGENPVIWCPWSHYCLLKVWVPKEYPFLILDTVEHKFTFIPMEGSVVYDIHWLGSEKIQLINTYWKDTFRFRNVDKAIFALPEFNWLPFGKIEESFELYAKNEFGTPINRLE